MARPKILWKETAVSAVVRLFAHLNYFLLLRAMNRVSGRTEQQKWKKRTNTHKEIMTSKTFSIGLINVNVRHCTWWTHLVVLRRVTSVTPMFVKCTLYVTYEYVHRLFLFCLIFFFTRNIPACFAVHIVHLTISCVWRVVLAESMWLWLW